MARLKFRKLIDDYTKKGHRNPLRAAVEERVRSDYVIRNRRSRVDDSVEALLAIEKAEGETLKSVLKDDHVWSIVVDHYIPKELGYDSALSNEFMHDVKQKVDKIPPKFEDFYPSDQFSKEDIKTKFDKQFEDIFGKPPPKTPKKAAGGVVSLYNRPGYAIGDFVTNNKLADAIKWIKDESQGGHDAEKIARSKRPLVYPQMTEQQFKDYSTTGFEDKLRDMYFEEIPSSSVMDIRKGGHEGLEQIFPDINTLMTGLPPTERDATVVESVGEQEWLPEMTSQTGEKYRYMFVKNEDGEAIPIGPEDYLELYNDPKTRGSVWVEDMTRGAENYMGEMMPTMVSHLEDPNSPLYNYETAAQWATDDKGGYKKYPGSEGYLDRLYEDYLRMGLVNTPAQFAHFVGGDAINIFERGFPSGETFKEGEMPEWWREAMEKDKGLAPWKSGDPDSWWSKNLGSDPYNTFGPYDWMRTWNPDWAKGLGGLGDMMSSLGGWFLNKEFEPKFGEWAEEKDWRLWNDRKDVVSISEHEAAELGVEPGVYVPRKDDPSKPDLDKKISSAVFDPKGGVQQWYDAAAEKFGWDKRDMRDYMYHDPMKYETTGISPNTRYGDEGVGSYPWLYPGQGYEDWIDPEYFNEETGEGRTFETPIISSFGTSQVGPMALFAKDIPRMLGRAATKPFRSRKSKKPNFEQIGRDLQLYLKYQKAGVKMPSRLKRLYETVTRKGTGRKTTDEFVDDLVKAIDADATATKKIEPPEKKKKKKKKKPEEKKKSTIITHDPDYIGSAHGGMVDVRDMTGVL